MDTSTLSLSLRDSGTPLGMVCLRFIPAISLLAATDLLSSKLVTFPSHRESRNMGGTAQVASRARAATNKPQDLEPSCHLPPEDLILEYGSCSEKRPQLVTLPSKLVPGSQMSPGA